MLLPVQRGGPARLVLMMLIFTLSSQLWNGTATAQEKRGDAIAFEVAVLPDAQRHIELLTYPAYLAVALENNGLSPSMSSRIIIQDGKALQIKNAVLRYSGKKGTTYIYDASVTWSIGVGETSFKIPVEVDTSAMQNGKMRVLVHLSLAKYFPQDLIDRISLKINTLADMSVQKKMIDYLDRLAEKRGLERGMEGTIELIMIEAYNRQSATGGAAAGREPGDAEPLSDQLLLLITLVIWLVIVPLAILGQYLWRKLKERRAAR